MGRPPACCGRVHVINAPTSLWHPTQSGYNIIFLLRRWNDIQNAFDFEDRLRISPHSYASPLLAKISAMRAVRGAFIFYAISWAILGKEGLGRGWGLNQHITPLLLTRLMHFVYRCDLGIASGFLDEYSWVESLVFELIEGIFYIWILWTFR